MYFIFFKVATLCLDDGFAQYWHSPNQLHEVVTWNANYWYHTNQVKM
jgi:hypothetical protein